MNKTIFVDPGFCGPPKTANGGYLSGLIAQHFDFEVEVTLHKPPPLSTSMNVVSDQEGIRLMHEDMIIARIKRGNIPFEAPEAPDFDRAVKASERYIGHEDHPFPGCFVCGTNRSKHDALCIFAGRVPGQNLVAAPWAPEEFLVDKKGVVKTEFIWAALDCPGSFAVARKPRPMVLGRMSAKIEQPIEIGERCVVIGWHEKSEGRKHLSGTAVYSEKNGLCAVALATWIDLK